MGAGKGTVYPWTADNKGLPVGFSGLSYGQDVGLQLTIAQQHTAVACPADTNENTLFSYAIPGGLMGPNDSIRISIVLSMTSSANGKTLRIRWGSSQIRGISYTTSAQATMQVRVSGRNSTQQQIIQIQADGSSASTANTASQDMMTPTVLEITGQMALGSELFALESVLVELLRGA